MDFDNENSHLLNFYGDLGNYNLRNFVSTPLSDTPWHPHRLIEVTVPGAQPSAQPSQQVFPFPSLASLLLQDYGSVPPVSESGTFPNDPGYGGSGPTFIDGVGSIHEDDISIDARHTDKYFTEFGLTHKIASHKPDFTPGLAIWPGIPPKLANNRLFCPECKTSLNTKAELNKHIQRHKKPYTCTYSNCNRSEKGNGFSTPNDLARHKRTVHKEHDLHGPVYVCTHEPCRSKKVKIWPRADNFRCHLARQHCMTLRAEDDLQDYIFRPLTTNRHDLQGIGQGLGPLEDELDPNVGPSELQNSKVPEDRQDPPHTNSPRWIPLQQERSSTSQQHHQHHQHQQQQTALSSVWPPPFTGLAIETNGCQQGNVAELDLHFAPGLNDMSFVDDQSAMEMISEVFESPPPPEDNAATVDLGLTADFVNDIGRENGAWASQAPANNATHSDETDELSISPCDSEPKVNQSRGDLPTDDALVKSLNEARSDPSRLIAILKSLPSQLLETALKGERGVEDRDRGNKEDKEETDDTDDLLREDAAPKANLKCPECDKSFGRLCELKKHRKRHDKPYGCTFKYCTKFFGSKNDWKRHESNQHFMLETWTCDIPGCHRMRHRREMFRNHLFTDHQLGNNPQLVEEKLERCRMGRHCDPRFWCGFCVKVIEIEEANVNSWAKRCDHIDNHLFGKGGLEKKPMSDWVYLDDDEESADMSDASDSEDLPTWSENEGKRKATDCLDTRRHKKAKEEGILMWHCCNCPNAAGLVHKMSPSCLECQHRTCSHCPQEMVTSIDEREQSARKMEGV